MHSLNVFYSVALPITLSIVLVLVIVYLWVGGNRKPYIIRKILCCICSGICMLLVSDQGIVSQG